MQLDEFLKRFPDAKASGGQHSARCPAHDDRNASLAIGFDDGRILLHCHAGCATVDVLRAVGLRAADLFTTNGAAAARIKPNGKGEVVAEYDYRDQAGKLLFQAVRFEPKDFRQRAPKPGGGWAWRLNGVARVLYRLPELLAADGQQIVFVVEGEKDADELRLLGLVATTNSGGAGKWRAEYSEALRGRNVVILPDNDPPGRDHAQQVAASLAGIAASVKIVELTGVPDKGDVSDWLAAGGTVAVLTALVAAAPEWRLNTVTSTARDSRPKIIIMTDEPAVINQAIEALEADPRIFKRGGFLAHVIRDASNCRGIVRPPDSPRIAPLTLATLRERMAGAAKWIKLVRTKDGGLQEIPAHPPEWAVKALAARGEWPNIRSLEGLVDVPILRPDGTILHQPGYDPATGLLYEPRGSFPEIPSTPTLAEARQAGATLLEVVEDFPFGKPAHKSGWLAAVLTPFTRFAFHGPAPMFTIEANVPGAGKGLAADCAAEIVCGGPMARMVNPDSDDEMRKRITALAIEGERLILIDNVGNTLGCPSLDAALTATTWKDRILGSNNTTRALPLAATWYATGNNLAIGGDTIRRVVNIRIESPLEKPEERSDFQHPDLLGWIRQDRGRLVAAALTILRAFCVAGRPKQNVKPWGSYEAWSATVREAIVWIGLDDPAGARDELAEQADHEAAALKLLMIGWEEIAGSQGRTVAEVFRMLDENAAAARIELGRAGHEPLEWENLRAAIAELSEKPLGVLPGPRSFGMKLAHLRGRVVGGKRFVARDERGTKVWRIDTTERGTRGTCGTNPVDLPTRGTEKDSLAIHVSEESKPAMAGNSPASPVSPAMASIVEGDA